MAILFVAPFAWLISASFQSIGDMFSWPPQWIPENPTTAGYKKFLGVGPQTGTTAREAWRWFANSTFVAVSVTVLQLFFNSLAPTSSPSGSSRARTSSSCSSWPR